jgi:hypothetical protein
VDFWGGFPRVLHPNDVDLSLGTPVSPGAIFMPPLRGTVVVPTVLTPTHFEKNTKWMGHSAASSPAQFEKNTKWMGHPAG